MDTPTQTIQSTPSLKTLAPRAFRRRSPGQAEGADEPARRSLRRLRQAPKALAVAATTLLMAACAGATPAPEPQVVITPAERVPVATDSVVVAVDPVVQETDARLTRARAAIRDARSVRADLYASANLQVAQDRLQVAERWRYDGRYLDAAGQASLAQHAAVGAYREAKPVYDAALARSAQREANKALVLELIAKSRSTPRVTEEGIEVPVYGAFLPLDDTLSASGEARLAELSAVARAHDAFTVEVEASPTDGLPPTDALNLGEARAVAAEAWIEAQGVASRRVSTHGTLDTAGRHLTVRFVPTRG